MARGAPSVGGQQVEKPVQSGAKEAAVKRGPNSVEVGLGSEQASWEERTSPLSPEGGEKVVQEMGVGAGWAGGWSGQKGQPL